MVAGRLYLPRHEGRAGETKMLIFLTTAKILLLVEVGAQAVWCLVYSRGIINSDVEFVVELFVN